MLKKLASVLCAATLLSAHAYAADNGVQLGKRDEYVGTIEMSEGGTITTVIATFTGRDFVDGLVRYHHFEPGYQAILSEVGGLQPGQVKRLREIPGYK